MYTNLAFGKEPHSFFALGMQDSIKGSSGTAEGIESHGSDYADIDAHIPAYDFILELPGVLAVGSEYGLCILIVVLVADLNCLI